MLNLYSSLAFMVFRCRVFNVTHGCREASVDSGSQCQIFVKKSDNATFPECCHHILRCGGQPERLHAHDVTPPPVSCKGGLDLALTLPSEIRGFRDTSRRSDLAPGARLEPGLRQNHEVREESDRQRPGREEESEVWL